MLAASHTHDYETAALGQLIFEPRLDAIARLNQADFVDPFNNLVFLAIDTLAKANTPIDLITINSHLKQRHGVDRFLELDDLRQARCAPSTLDHAIEQLKARRVAGLLAEANDELGQGTDPMVLARKIAGLVEEAKPAAQEEAKEPQKRFKVFSLSDCLTEVLEEIREHKEQPFTIRGIPSGINELDDATLGFENGELIVIGARPGVGKTTLGMNLAANVAGHYRLPVLFVCLEMSRLALTRRYLAARTRIATRDMRRGNVQDLAPIEQVVFSEKAPITIVDQRCGVRTPGDVRNLFKQLDPRPRLVIFDHFHAVGSDSGIQGRYEQLTEISRAFKNFAADENVPVIALCQLKRPEQRGSKGAKPDLRPTLTDLKDSGSIEQDADQVIMIHRPHYYDTEAPATQGWLLVRKNREGPLEDIEVHYDAVRSLFRSTTNETPILEIFDPEKAAEAKRAREPTPEVIPEAEEVKPAVYEVIEIGGEIYYCDCETGEKTPRVWPMSACEEKVRNALDAGTIEQFWKDANAFVGNQTNETREAWAGACFERLVEAHERIDAEAADDLDLSAFGFVG